MRSIMLGRRRFYTFLFYTFLLARSSLARRSRERSERLAKPGKIAGMITWLLSFAVLQGSAPNPACTTLAAAQVTSLIGAAKTIPVSAAPGGSTCMFQAGDKIITVLVVNNESADAATRLFDSKKRIASGNDIAGWPVPAYSGHQPPAAVIVGFLKGTTFTEVKLVDSTKYPEGLETRLKAVVKETVARK